MNKKNVKNNNDEKLILAVLVKEARLMKNISQRELSRRTGVDNNTLAKIERGIRKKPNLKSLKSLSDELDIPFSKLLKACHYDQISEEAYLQFEENMKLLNSIDAEDSGTIATKNLKDKLDKLDKTHILVDTFTKKEVLNSVTKDMSKEEKNLFNSAYIEFLEQYAWNIEDLRRRAKMFASVYEDGREKDDLYVRYEKEEKRWIEDKKKGIKPPRINPSINLSGMYNNDKDL